jgi:CRISPR/Cas system-associated endonuclease Cas1
MGRQRKVVNLLVDTFGNYLGMDRGCVVLRDKERNEKKYPLFEDAIGEVVLTSGNVVSTQALTALGFWGIDVVIASRNGRPVAVLKNLEDDSHVKTRISQYEAVKNGKGIDVAKQIVTAKLLSQNQVLKKHGLRQHDIMGAKEAIAKIDTDKLTILRKRLINIEGRFSARALATTIMFNDKKGKRIFLNKAALKALTDGLYNYFRNTVDIPNVKRGKRQEIESLINEEARLLAKYLRSERKLWTPRIVPLLGTPIKGVSLG